MKQPIAGQALRDATVRDYTRNAQRLGLPVDQETIRRQAEADLVLVDAYNREVRLVPAAKKVKKPAAPRVDELDQAIAALGPRRVQPGRAPRVRDRALYQRAPKYAGTVWWWPHAVARIKRLLQGAKGTSLIVGVQSAEAPELALEFTRHWAALIQRRPWGEMTGARPYDGLSDTDAERKFVAQVESICERSKKLPGLREWRFR